MAPTKKTSKPSFHFANVKTYMENDICTICQHKHKSSHKKKPSSQGMEMWKRCISDLVQLMYQTIAYIWTVYVLMFSL